MLEFANRYDEEPKFGQLLDECPRLCCKFPRKPVDPTSLQATHAIEALRQSLKAFPKRPVIVPRPIHSTCCRCGKLPFDVFWTDRWWQPLDGR